MPIICNICNKEYAIYSSRSNHIKKFHSDSIYEKTNNVTKKSENTGKIVKNGENNKNEKYNCKVCKSKFNNITDLDSHAKLKCKPDIKHNNVFKFNTNTFGKNKYPDDNGGDIYIIQTDFTLKGYYKIGITTNLYHRMSQYRCGAVIEPRIHCYFPIKNIKKADTLMKNRLSKYNVKREIYKADNLVDITKIIKELQKEMNSEELEVLPEIKICDMIECKYCDTVHTSNYELNIHLVNCEKYNKLKKVKNINKYENGNIDFNIYLLDRVEKENELLKQLIYNYKKEFEDIKEQMLEMLEMIEIVNKHCNMPSETHNEIIAIGFEQLNEILSKKEKLWILNNSYKCLENMIKYVHFNEKYPLFRNIKITNMQNSLAYRYDTNEKDFLAISKNELLDDLISKRMNDINCFYEEYKNELDIENRTNLEAFMDKMENNDEFKKYKKEEVKLVIYNNRNKVSKEITQDLEIIV